MTRFFRIALSLLLVACTTTPSVPSPVGSRPSALPSATSVSSAEAAPAPSGEVPAAWPFKLDVPPAFAPRTMVTTDAPLATRVGVEVLAEGGNAIDAAVAVAFALAVVYPEAGNLGGGGFAVLRTKDGTLASLDFRETAPGASTHDMFLDAKGKPAKLVVNGKTLTDGRGRALEKSKAGHLSSGVPGSVAGLWELYRRYGSKPWKELLAPAIELAEKGFVLSDLFADTLAENQATLAHFAGSKQLFFSGEKVFGRGSTFRNPDLAATLKLIRDRGKDGFYKGRIAELIAAEMKRGGGILSKEDLAAYEAKWRAPIAFEYRGTKVVSMPPPSSGGVALAMIAGILKGYPLKNLGWHSTAHLHVLAEAMRRAFADRNALLGDPDFVEMPIEKLVSDAYGASLRATIGEKATPSSEVKSGSPPPEGIHTTHFGVIDADGAAVAMTTTLNDLYGSGVTVDHAGFLMNDEMDDFAVKPGTPNMFGLVQGEANAVAKGRRMLSSMAPTIVLDKDNRVILVAGARGGSRIITATWQVLSNVVDFGMQVSSAVNAPRIHQQHLPDELFYEKDGIPTDEIHALELLGYAMKAVPTLANSPALSRARSGSGWDGWPDPRRGGAAAGN